MKLGTATSVLFQHALQDAIPLVARAGYDGMDIWGGRPHAYRHDLSPLELTRLRQQMTDHNLSVSSFMPAFYRYPHSLSSPNPKVRADSIDYMRICIDNAAVLGAGIVLIVPDLSLHGQPREASLGRMIESLDEVAQYAAGHPMKLGVEILYYDETDYVNSADDALHIIHTLGYDNLGVVLDSGTLNLSKEPIEELFGKLGSLILQIHVNDNMGKQHQQNLIPGEGTYDFAGLIRYLKQIGYSGFLSAELTKEYSSDPEPALRTTAERLRAWIAAA